MVELYIVISFGFLMLWLCHPSVPNKNLMHAFVIVICAVFWPIFLVWGAYHEEQKKAKR